MRSSFERAREIFFEELDGEEARAAYSRLTPEPFKPFGEAVPNGQFFDLAVPREYILCTRDLAVPRERALELFARLRVWDTAENSGILIYLQLVDHDVEILADRGIATKVPQAAWDALCHELEAAMRAGRCRAGVLAAIAGATRLLAEHFPAAGNNPNELPDTPLML